MGSIISSYTQTKAHFLSSNTSETTRSIVLELLQYMREEKITDQEWSAIKENIGHISKKENILAVPTQDGYNLLQHAIGSNCTELVHWILKRGCAVNRGDCSLPLHIAALYGTQEIVKLLLRHGARVDLEARMCFPGPHAHNCELRFQVAPDKVLTTYTPDRLQSAEYYAIYGDQAGVLEVLLAHGEDHWLPWQQKQPLLHIACKRGAWNCTRYLIAERPEEVNQCYEDYYPIHHAVIQELRFLALFIQCGADFLSRTATQKMTLLHVILLSGRKCAEETLNTIKMLIEHGCREVINEPDTLGNTPLHALIVRYAHEESRYESEEDPQPWNRWDMLHMVSYLLQNGASPSINHQGNSALACVLRHVRNLEFRYELLELLLQYNGDPNCIGLDGSVPLMICLVPLINKDPLHYVRLCTKKIFYFKAVYLLCQYGADPNWSSTSNLTPLQVLIFIANEYLNLNSEEDKRNAFKFIKRLLVIFLKHGLDPNMQFSKRTEHALLAIIDLVQDARVPSDLNHIFDLSMILVRYGANPNIIITTTEPMICPSRGLYLKKESNWVLYHYVQHLIDKEELLNDDDETFKKLYCLYYLSMNHEELFKGLKTVSTLTTPVGSKVTNFLRQLSCHPRTLKQMARVAIFNSLNYRIAPNVNKLPLPKTLKDYILEFLL